MRKKHSHLLYDSDDLEYCTDYSDDSGAFPTVPNSTILEKPRSNLNISHASQTKASHRRDERVLSAKSHNASAKSHNASAKSQSSEGRCHTSNSGYLSAPPIAVVGGPVDSGKSTLIGYIISKESRTKAKDLASLLDSSTAERERRITIDLKLIRASYKLYNKDYNFLLLDTPGHCDLFVSLIKASLLAKIPILILDITKILGQRSFANSFGSKLSHSTGAGPSGQLACRDSADIEGNIPLGLNHLMIYNHCIGSDVIICVNKMDRVNYSEFDFNIAKSCIKDAWSLISDSSPNFVIIPIVASAGYNVDKSPPFDVEEFNWYSGNSLFQELSLRFESLDLLSRDANNAKANRGLLCHVIDQWASNKNLNLTLFVESGMVDRSFKAIAMPFMLDVTVQSEKVCYPGEICDVSLRSGSMESLGEIISIAHGDLIPRMSKRIVVRLYVNRALCGVLLIGESLELIFANFTEEAYIECIEMLDSGESICSMCPGSEYYVFLCVSNPILSSAPLFSASALSSLNGASVGCIFRANWLSSVVVRRHGQLAGWGTVVFSD